MANGEGLPDGMPDVSGECLPLRMPQISDHLSVIWRVCSVKFCRQLRLFSASFKAFVERCSRAANRDREVFFAGAEQN